MRARIWIFAGWAGALVTGACNVDDLPTSGVNTSSEDGSASGAGGADRLRETPDSSVDAATNSPSSFGGSKGTESSLTESGGSLGGSAIGAAGSTGRGGSLTDGGSMDLGLSTGRGGSLGAGGSLEAGSSILGAGGSPGAAGSPRRGDSSNGIGGSIGLGGSSVSDAALDSADSTGVGSSSGAGGTVGSGGSTGTGGLATGFGGSMGTGGSIAPTAYSCQPFVPVANFPSDVINPAGGVVIAYEGCAISLSDEYVTSTAYGGQYPLGAQGTVVHNNGSSWSAVSLPNSPGKGTSHTWTVACPGANDVWIGGAEVPVTGGGTAAQLWHKAGDAFSVEPVGFTSEDHIVADVVICGSSVFLTDQSFTFANASNVWRKSGGTWMKMATPVPPNTAGGGTYPNFWIRHLACSSDTDVYAVGVAMDENSNPVRGLLWHWNGSMWSDVATIPQDSLQLMDVSAIGEEVMAVGTFADGTGYHGVRFSSTDQGAHWTRFNSSVTGIDAAVMIPRSGAALVGGAFLDPDGTELPGYARLGTRSLGAWIIETAVDGSAEAVTAIWPVPGTNQVHISVNAPPIYVGICQ